jgi:HlyD family secretion protein
MSRQQLALTHPPLVALDIAEPSNMLRVGYIGIGIFAAIFTLWSIFAPLNSAAIAPGLLRAEGGGRKAVQHLEGGIIKRLAVKDGEQVKQGQLLVQLDMTQSGAVNSVLQGEADLLAGQAARLNAEIAGESSITFPQALLARRADANVADIMRRQSALISARREDQRGQTSILRERIAQVESEIGSLGAQINANTEQQRLLSAEIAISSALVEAGLERQSRKSQLERQLAGLAGEEGRLRGDVQRARQSISEIRSQMGGLRSTSVAELTAVQRDVQSRLAEITERLTAAQDVNQRREVRAPVDGRVVDLRYVTVGAVVAPGAVLMDIMPRAEKLVVIARLKPVDVEAVQEGHSAQVRLNPYKARRIPLIKGIVRRVSADVYKDERTGATYYETEISLDAGELQKLPSVQLRSGMPAEVFIDLEKTSLLQYLTQPFLDSFDRAFRES